MIEDAEFAQNRELFDRLQDYKMGQWKQVISEQHDLIYYGRCSYLDVEQMTPYERAVFIQLTRDKIKTEQESYASMFRRK